MLTSQQGKALVALRFAVGISSWLTPGLAGKAFGMDIAANPQAPYLARLFGIRDVALAAGVLQSSGEARRVWWRIGILCDVFDVGAALLAGRDGSFKKPTTIVTAATAAGAVVLGAAALASNDV